MIFLNCQIRNLYKKSLTTHSFQLKKYFVQRICQSILHELIFILKAFRIFAQLLYLFLQKMYWNHITVILIKKF